MELVIDGTILFTGLIGKGVTKQIIFSKSVELCCPEALFNEAELHKSRIKILSGLSSIELEALLRKLKGVIRIFPSPEYEEFLREANDLISDPDDTEYLALSLALNKHPIWSNDPHFKEQSVVKIYKEKDNSVRNEMECGAILSQQGVIFFLYARNSFGFSAHRKSSISECPRNPTSPLGLSNSGR